MSLISCERCDAIIDSDADPGCFLEAPTCIPFNRNLEEVVCETCRESAWDRQHERLTEG